MISNITQMASPSNAGPVNIPAPAGMPAPRPGFTLYMVGVLH
jgi:hypothetical protein